MRRLFTIATQSWERYDNDHGDLLAAAISFYSLLSLAPLGVVALTVAGIVFDRQQARTALLDSVKRFASEDIARLLLRQLDAAEQSSGRVAAVIALLTLCWAASRLFVQLQESLNLMWGVRVRDAKNKRETIERYVLQRLLSFAMVMGSGMLLLCLLVLQTLLNDVSGLLGKLAHTPLFSGAVGIAQQTVVPLALLSLICAIIYRVLPDARIHWRDVWAGALLTATLILLGTWLLGLYLTRIAPVWLQGAVGSIALFMIWTYYLAQVFLFGAAFTRVWAGRTGDSIRPAAYAELRPDHEAHDK
jgi:membrane protein